MEKFAGPIELTDAELMAVAGGLEVPPDIVTSIVNNVEASVNVAFEAEAEIGSTQAHANKA
jgi:hypothetical protein